MSQFFEQLADGWLRVLRSGDRGLPRIDVLPSERTDSERVHIRGIRLTSVDDRPVDSGVLRSIPMGLIESWLNAPAPLTVVGSATADLGASGGTATGALPRSSLLEGLSRRRDAHGDYGDDFYRAVAQAYSDLVAGDHRAPAQVLSERHKVPVTTIHRWVKTARTRGFLAPGRKGKAG